MNFPIEIVRAAAQRYAARQAQRDDAKKNIATGNINAANADDPTRVEKRRTRLAFDYERSQIMAAAGTRAYSEAAVAMVETPRRAYERILGKNNLIGISYFDRATRAARTVGRVIIRDGGGNLAGYGTGFLVSPRLMITNNHVLGSAAEAAASLVEFNYQDDLGGRATPTVQFELDASAFFATSPQEQLDQSVVAVRENSRDGATPLRAFGWNRLIELEGKAVKGEYLNIVQHPQGRPEQLALRDNLLVDILELFLHYETDTEPGSSGSPVFNDQWEVVALHHSGVPRMVNGQPAKLDGTPATSSTPDSEIDWIANEGVRVSRILRDLKNAQLSSPAARLRDELLEAPLPPTELEPPDAIRQGPDFLASGQGNAMTFTIPIRVSISVGDRMPAPPTPLPAAPPTTPPPPPPSAPPARGGGDDDDNEPPPTSAEVEQALRAVRAAEALPYYPEAQDTAARTAYYNGIPANLSKAQLYDRLSTLLEQTHTTRPAYKPLIEVYPLIDLHPDKKIHSVYSDKPFAPEVFITEDARIDRERDRRFNERMRTVESFTNEARLEELSLIEAALPYNCEHVVPQSWFKKKEPMRGDIHHLFACESGCNSFRSNHPYIDFPDFEEVIRTACGKLDGGNFEPSAGKGAVSRAVLYFVIRYPSEINSTVKEYTAERLETIITWCRDNPVTQYERHRNHYIFKRQGNRNPLIDFPQWIDKIDFKRGLGN